MGWWKADDNGQIDMDDVPRGKNRPKGPVILNKGPDDEGPLVGDWPADILGDALSEVIKAYKDDLGREPTMQELDLCWQFVTGVRRRTSA